MIVGEYLASSNTVSSLGLGGITTLTDISGLSIPLVSGASYSFEVYVPFDLSGVASGYKFAVAFSGTNSTFKRLIEVYNGIGLTLVSATVDATAAGALAVIGNHVMKASGCIKTTSAGDLTVQMAQNVSDASAINYNPGRYMVVRQVG